MSPGPEVCCRPGRAVPPLLTTAFWLTVSPRCSPLFTVMLVHGWYMKPLHCVTTQRGGSFGARWREEGFRRRSMPREYRWREPSRHRPHAVRPNCPTLGAAGIISRHGWVEMRRTLHTGERDYAWSYRGLTRAVEDVRPALRSVCGCDLYDERNDVVAPRV